MNLWLRLLIFFAGAPFRSRLAAPDGLSRVTFRVLPNDLDTNLHMNNGRFLTLMDIGRLDVMLRTGLARIVWRRKWTPVLSAATIRFRRELRLFQRFVLETRIVWWSHSQFVIEHRMLADTERGPEQVMAVALVLGGFYERAHRRFVPVEEFFAAMGIHAVSPAATPQIEAFLAGEEALRQIL